VTPDQRERLRGALRAHGFRPSAYQAPVPNMGLGAVREAETWVLARHVDEGRPGDPCDHVQIVWGPPEPECGARASGDRRDMTTCGEEAGHAGLHRRNGYGAWA
jgi:hypothetical protein